jgi:hypothetical protein
LTKIRPAPGSGYFPITVASGHGRWVGQRTPTGRFVLVVYRIVRAKRARSDEPATPIEVLPLASSGGSGPSRGSPGGTRGEHANGAKYPRAAQRPAGGRGVHVATRTEPTRVLLARWPSRTAAIRPTPALVAEHHAQQLCVDQPGRS